MWYLIVFLIGFTIGFLIAAIMRASGNAYQAEEAYNHGFEDGKRSNEKEV